jgi:phospholipase C
MDDTIVQPQVDQVSPMNYDAEDETVFVLGAEKAPISTLTLQNDSSAGFFLSLDFKDNTLPATKTLINKFLTNEKLDFQLVNGANTMSFTNTEVTAMYGFSNFSLKTLTQPTIT